MYEAASSSSLSSPPTTNNEGGSSQDVSVTGSPADLEWPQLRGGRKAKAKAAPKNQITESTSQKADRGEVDEVEQENEPAPPKRNSKRKASDPGEGSSAASVPRKRASLGRTAKSKKWDAPHVLTNKSSPLGKTRDRNDLLNMLLLPEAWDILTEEEKAEILALFPDKRSILNPGTSQARPDVQVLKSNTGFRADCVSYATGIANGRHEEQWLREAWDAHTKHSRGEYGPQAAKTFKRSWGEDMPERTYPGTGSSSASKRPRLRGGEVTGSTVKKRSISSEPPVKLEKEDSAYSHEYNRTWVKRATSSPAAERQGRIDSSDATLNTHPPLNKPAPLGQPPSEDFVPRAGRTSGRPPERPGVRRKKESTRVKKLARTPGTDRPERSATTSDEYEDEDEDEYVDGNDVARMAILVHSSPDAGIRESAEVDKDT
ncbi:Asx homology domain-containing protein [Immersiella caudata]|uniref:Asx homology domain-containing protein n=1 Tax=Immersiella caudata TaxID=314043 RepID=A0AA39X3I6_9PEZI|nr:Asx homology domain-containing protein [Immersiella caudata]